MAHTDKPLTAKSSVGDWLKHPVGGPVLREMLAQAGRDESVLRPVRMFSLQRLMAMSQGMLTQEIVDDLVARAAGGVVPAVAAVSSTAADEAADVDDDFLPEPWQERIVPDRFLGKTVIVTGAGSGIGRATASRIAREGGRVIAVDIAEGRLLELAAAHRTDAVVTVTGDITEESDVARIVAAAQGRIDGLANVAGVTDDMTPLHEVSDAVWERVFAVNVDGMFRLTRAVLPFMLAARRGSIVNVASEAALRGSAAGLAYTASKHAVVGITRSSAFMYGRHGVRINAVAPGPVATNIEGNFASDLGQKRISAAMTVMPDLAEAGQLAASITFLLSDDGTNVSGAILPSDGGWSAA